MKITLTLSEVLKKCNDWDYFCETEGISVWAINEGFGDSKVTLTLEKAQEYGLILRDKNEHLRLI